MLSKCEHVLAQNDVDERCAMLADRALSNATGRYSHTWQVKGSGSLVRRPHHRPAHAAGGMHARCAVSARPVYLWRDQYGTTLCARTVKELRAQVGMGGSRVSKMYVDKTDGSTAHIGYVVGRQWFAKYAPVESPA